MGRGTQLCESFHGIVAQLAPKDRHVSSTRDYKIRVNLGVLKNNEKTEYQSQVLVASLGIMERNYRVLSTLASQLMMEIRG